MTSKLTLVALLDFPGSYQGKLVKRGEKFEAASENDKHVFLTVGHARVATREDFDEPSNVSPDISEDKKPKSGKRNYQTRDMQAQS